MTQDHGLDSPTNPGLAPSTLTRTRQNGNLHQSQQHISHTQQNNSSKETGALLYKENSHGRSSTQQQQQQQMRQTQSNHQQALVHSHSTMDSTQNHISGLSPQLREQIQQHQLKQQLLKEQMQGKAASPVQANATPLYVNTDTRRQG